MEIKGNGSLYDNVFECGRALGQMEGYIKALKTMQEAKK